MDINSKIKYGFGECNVLILSFKGLRNEMLILINYLMSDPQALHYFFERSAFPTHSKQHTFLGKVVE